jgi:hypothetical protein
MIKPIRFFGIAAIAFVSACGADGGVAPSSNIPADLATAFNELSVPGLSAFASFAGTAYTPAASSIPTGCGYAAISQSFVCPAVTTNGVTVTSSYSLLDGTGRPMSQFDANTVASLRVRSTIAGVVTASGDIYAIDGQQDQTLSGLQGATHTLNGTSTLNVSGTRSSSAIQGPFSTRSTTTMSNVVLPAHGSSSAYPSSGSITLDQTTSFVGGLSVSSRMVMTFNGSSKVTVALTVDGLTLPRCTIDLSSATPSCG